MSRVETLHLFFDYVDPASFLLELRLRGLEETGTFSLLLEPFELRPPPAPLLNPEGPEWQARLHTVAPEAARAGVRFPPPRLIPWTRKAHELALHAGERGCFREVHDALFLACLLEGRDIGRVDVLVELAVGAGLERMETRAVLDVDRHRQEVENARERALGLGVSRVPTLHWRGRSLEGFPAEERLREFLAP